MMLNAGWIGGVILFNQNIQSKQQVALYVKQLQKNSPTPLFVAVDQEGGAVRRFREEAGFQRLPSLQALGQTQNTNLAYRFGLLSGRQLKAVGANLNLAPVVDIDRGITDSIITKYHRSLGSSPELVSSMALQIIRGMKAQNIIATAKHFPSQSVVTANTHEETAVTEISLHELETEDFMPYRKLIDNHLLDAVMLSHVIYKNVDPLYPASLSPAMIQTFLRQKLGYQGLVISDDLRMGAIKQNFPIDISVVQAVNAGVDVLLVTDNFERRVMDTLVRGVVSGKIPVKNIDDAYKRIMSIKAKYGILARHPQSPKFAQRPPISKPNSLMTAAPKLQVETHALGIPNL
jgi:beta-N-acetylhexosaminidase